MDDLPFPAAPCSSSTRALVGLRAQSLIRERSETRVSGRQAFEVLGPTSFVACRRLIVLSLSIVIYEYISFKVSSALTQIRNLAGYLENCSLRIQELV